MGSCSLWVFLSQSSRDKLALTQILIIQLLGDPLIMGDGDRKDCFTDINIFLPRSLPMCREYCIREHCWRDQREKEGEKIQPVEALGTIFIIHYIIIRGKSRIEWLYSAFYSVILATIWLHFDNILPLFCLHSAYILTTFDCFWLFLTDWLTGGGGWYREVLIY